MEAVRELWTDERLDDLTHRVDDGFNRNEREFQAVRLEIRTEFAAVRSEIRTEFTAVRSEMGGLRSELADLNRTLVQIAVGGFVTLAVGLLGLIATQV